jgi:hypothetical protein
MADRIEPDLELAAVRRSDQRRRVKGLKNLVEQDEVSFRIRGERRHEVAQHQRRLARAGRARRRRVAAERRGLDGVEPERQVRRGVPAPRSRLAQHDLLTRSQVPRSCLVTLEGFPERLPKQLARFEERHPAFERPGL